MDLAIILDCVNFLQPFFFLGSFVLPPRNCILFLGILSLSFSLSPFPLTPKQTKVSANNAAWAPCDSRKIRLAIFSQLCFMVFIDFPSTPPPPPVCFYKKKLYCNIDRQYRKALKILIFCQWYYKFNIVRFFVCFMTTFKQHFRVRIFKADSDKCIVSNFISHCFICLTSRHIATHSLQKALYHSWGKYRC